jgi:hypothetical protein
MVTRAPILKSLRRIVPQVASATELKGHFCRRSGGSREGAFAAPIAHARAAHRDRADAGHDLALGQMSVAPEM